MKSTAILFVAYATGATACGGSTPAPSAPPPATSASTGTSDNPNRALSEEECRSLGAWLTDACQNRPNERSARVDGWCSEIVTGVEKGSWVPRDCLKHIRYMDSACLREARNVHVMMDCDRSVDRSE